MYLGPSSMGVLNTSVRGFPWIYQQICTCAAAQVHEGMGNFALCGAEPGGWMATSLKGWHLDAIRSKKSFQSQDPSPACTWSIDASSASNEPFISLHRVVNPTSASS